jgi:hypothetical protein
MNLPADDPTRWPLSKFVREFMTMHWDGRLVLGSMAVNWAAGLLSAVALLVGPGSTALAWVHVLLFGGMPVAGFVWFLRDTVSWRERGQVAVSLVFQAFLALLPLAVLVQSLLRKAG